MAYQGKTSMWKSIWTSNIMDMWKKRMRKNNYIDITVTL